MTRKAAAVALVALAMVGGAVVFGGAVWLWSEIDDAIRGVKA